MISGTSAGGINGVCLAKALANGTSLASLKKVWLNDGDIGVLVADRRSAYEDDAMQEPWSEDWTDPFDARSLLNADRMLMRLITAFLSTRWTHRSPGSRRSSTSSTSG